MTEFVPKDKVKIIEDSAMSLFGYSLGETFEVVSILGNTICIDKNKPNEYWKTWRFKKV